MVLRRGTPQGPGAQASLSRLGYPVMVLRRGTPQGPGAQASLSRLGYPVAILTPRPPREVSPHGPTGLRGTTQGTA
jgi:hypothetical protein